MKIALVGTGRMGKAVEALAAERGHEITARFNTLRPLTSAHGIEDLCGADVAIDFTLPSVASSHFSLYCAWRQPAVIGTTGWYEDVSDLQRLVEESGAAVVHAPNFSLGIAVVMHLLQTAGLLVDRLGEFDATIHEMHHVGKVDRPSGTALHMARTLLSSMTRKKRVKSEPHRGKVDPETLYVTASRVGSVFGAHTVTIDGDFDQIVLTHEAKSRNGFALGALTAAEWLPGRKGLFTLGDVLFEKLHDVANEE